MQHLIEYIQEYANRGACRCGKCADAPANPEQHQPTGHTADLGFFQVSAREGADAAELKRLIEANPVGEFGNVNLFDGELHHFTEIGGWIGDQGLALQLMGLGSVLGLFRIFGKDQGASIVARK